MIPKILAPLAGILLLASYAFAATVSTASLTTMIPSPAAKFTDIDVNRIHLTPQAAVPNPCPAGTLYYNQVLDGLYLCNAVDASNDINAWLRTDGAPGGMVFLKNGNDKIMNSGTFIGLDQGFSINNGTLAVAKLGAGNTNSTTDLAIIGRGNLGLLYNPNNGSLRVGGNVLIGSLGAYNPYSAVFGMEHVVDPTASFLSVLGGSNHSISGTITHAVIGGGDRNGINADLGAVVGGNFNIVGATHGFIGSGYLNQILANSTHSAIPGGESNTIENSSHAVIGGGRNNEIGTTNGAGDSVIAGGNGNRIDMSTGFIGGGSNNTILNDGSTTWSGLNSGILGGANNTASGEYSFIVGAGNNIAGDNSVAIGTQHNITNAAVGAVSIGTDNDISGANSFGIGTGARVTVPNRAAFSNVRVAIGRNDATEALHVNGYGLFFNGYAVGSGEPLIILGSMIRSDGSIQHNSGVSGVSRAAEGTYEISYPLTTNPRPLVTVISDQPGLTATVSNLTNGTATVMIYDPVAEKLVDSDFYVEIKGGSGAAPVYVP